MDTHHDLIRQAPNYLANFVEKVISNSHLVCDHRRTTAYPFEGHAIHGNERWEFEADTKSALDQMYLSKLEIFFSPITWSLLDDDLEGCEPLLISR
jgi:hypothetical protein